MGKCPCRPSPDLTSCGRGRCGCWRAPWHTWGRDNRGYCSHPPPCIPAPGPHLGPAPGTSHGNGGIQALPACQGPVLTLWHLPALQSSEKKSKCMSPVHAPGSSHYWDQVPLPGTPIPAESHLLFQFGAAVAAPVGPLPCCTAVLPGLWRAALQRAPHPGLGVSTSPQLCRASPDGHWALTCFPRPLAGQHPELKEVWKSGRCISRAFWADRLN